MVKRIGIMTGGGDCSGLNAAIRAVVYAAFHKNIEVLGFFKGWKGFIEKKYQILNIETVSEILSQGGTILHSLGNFNPLQKKEWVKNIKSTFSSLKLDAGIIIGGDITLSQAYELYRQENLPLIGIPKTIDNDIEGTDQSIGFDTTVSIAAEAIERIYTTARSHDRVMIVEVMGRHRGWIATYAGIAAGADFILIPEVKISVNEVISGIQKHRRYGKLFSVIVVAEGALNSQALAASIEKKIGTETRVTVLGHIQRGGSPTVNDRILATRLGVHSVNLACEKKFGQMVALRDNRIKQVPLEEAAQKNKKCDLSIYQTAKLFFR